MTKNKHTSPPPLHVKKLRVTGPLRWSDGGMKVAFDKQDADVGGSKPKQWNAVNFKNRFKSPKPRDQTAKEPTSPRLVADVGVVKIRRTTVSVDSTVKPAQSKTGGVNTGVVNHPAYEIAEAFKMSKREWDEKRASIETEYNVEKSIITALYNSNLSMRSGKLLIKEREFANNLEQHERLKGNDHDETAVCDMAPLVSSGDVEMPAGNDHKENDKGHDENETGENDVAPHVSGDVQVPVGSLCKENDHEDGNVGIDVMETPAGACHDEDIELEEGEYLPMDTLDVEQINIANQGDQIIPRVEPDMLSPISVVQDKEVNPFNLQQSSADKLDQTVLDDELDVPVAENPSDTVQHDQNISDVEPDMQPSGAGQVDQTILDDEPEITVSENLVSVPATVTRITNQPDQLQAEVERLNRIRDAASKSYQDEKQKLNSECEKEIAEVVAQIRLKYEAKQQHTDSDYKLKNKELENNIKWANWFKTVGEGFRSMCEEDLTPDHPGVQASHAEITLRRFTGASCMMHYHDSSASSDGQSLGNHQSPPLPTPLQQPEPSLLAPENDAVQEADSTGEGTTAHPSSAPDLV